MIKIANDVGGEDHGFKFIQLPYNSFMTEPYTYRNQQLDESSQYVSILNAANHFGIHVFTSIPLFQGKLLSLEIDDKFLSNLPYESLKLLQFVRSTPGIIAPLVGQKTGEHTSQNIVISKYPRLTEDEFREVLGRFDSLKKQFR
jgi:predicted aldo/keto reductase-like oxidoreductase